MTLSSGKNQLFYGDNYDVLQRYIREESVDLIYLDPPFNSRQDYNVLFAEKDGSKSSSQIHAFEDTWEWNLDAERSYELVVERIGGPVADAMRAFRTFLGTSDMMAYLAMMAPRLVEAEGAQGDRVDLSALRSYCESLFKNTDGCSVWAAPLFDRDYLEA